MSKPSSDRAGCAPRPPRAAGAARRRARARTAWGSSRRRSRRRARCSSGRSPRGRSGSRSCTGAIVSFSALPGPSGSGSSSVSPWNSTRSRASAMRTTATYSRVRWSCLAKRCPCQPSATCGPEEPMPQHHAPARELVDRRGGHRGHRRAARRASGRSPSRAGSSPSARRASRAPWRRRSRRPRRPTPSHSRAARPPGRCASWSCGGEAEAPVADVHAELHVQVSFQREGSVAGEGRVTYAGPRTRRER